MKTKLLLSCGVLSAALLAGCSSAERAGTPGAPAITGVKVETIHYQSTPDFYEAVGTVRSVTSSALGAEISGSVREVRARAGDRVRRGQVLAVIDDRAPRAQLEAAQAGVGESAQGLVEVQKALEAARADRQFAETTYRRYQELLAKNSVSKQEFDGAEARYKGALAQEQALEAKARQAQERGKQAQAEQASAETQLSHSRVVAPMDGVVTAKFVDAGTLVMPGTPLFTVEDPSRYRLEATLPEDLLGKVQLGQELPVATERGAWTGRVSEVVPAADPASRTFTIKVDLPNKCACRSGEFGKARVPASEAKGLQVPTGAIVRHGELEGVFVVNAQNVAEYRLVKTGKTLEGRTEIVSGLADGERLAVTALDRLSDGAKVEAP